MRQKIAMGDAVTAIESDLLPSVNSALNGLSAFLAQYQVPVALLRQVDGAHRELKRARESLIAASAVADSLNEVQS